MSVGVHANAPVETPSWHVRAQSWVRRAFIGWLFLMTLALTLISYASRVYPDDGILYVSDDRKHIQMMDDGFTTAGLLKSHGDHLVPTLRAIYRAFYLAFGYTWWPYATLLLLGHATLAWLMGVTVLRLGGSRAAAIVTSAFATVSVVYATVLTTQFVCFFMYLGSCLCLLGVHLVAGREARGGRGGLVWIAAVAFVCQFLYAAYLIVLPLLVVCSVAIRLRQGIRRDGRALAQGLWSLVDVRLWGTLFLLGVFYVAVYLYGVFYLSNSSLGNQSYNRTPCAASAPMRFQTSLSYAWAGGNAPVQPAPEHANSMTFLPHYPVLHGVRVRSTDVLTGFVLLAAGVLVVDFLRRRRARPAGARRATRPEIAPALLLLAGLSVLGGVAMRPRLMLWFGPYVAPTTTLLLVAQGVLIAVVLSWFSGRARWAATAALLLAAGWLGANSYSEGQRVSADGVALRRSLFLTKTPVRMDNRPVPSHLFEHPDQRWSRSDRIGLELPGNRTK